MVIFENTAGAGSFKQAMMAVCVGAVALCMAACDQPASVGHEQAAAKAPRQAGQPLNPLAVAGRIAATQGAALRGDQRGVQANAQALAEDFRKSINLPDASRPIDHEAARAAIRPLAGVRSSAWVDQSNLIVMVDGAQYRNMQTINRVCNALTPLGDTLGVVVSVQNVAAKNSHEADTLSRNCQLPEGERAFMQQKRQIDALDPATRREFEVQQGYRTGKSGDGGD